MFEFRRIRSLMQKVDASPAVTWGVLVRIWQIAAGAVSFVLLGTFMSADSRGYYVTLWSFVQLQTMVDLGFSIAITNFSSHEWSRLHLDANGSIDGDREALGRLISLGRAALLWFSVGSVLFFLLAGVPATIVFAAKENSEISWQIPLWATLAFSAVSLFSSPFLSMLEGCGQVERVYRFRLIQAIFANIAVWATLYWGGGLFAAVASAGVRAVSEVLFLSVGYGKFFRPFRVVDPQSTFSWAHEFWPVQWRLAVGGVFSFFAYSLFNPVMFHYHSERLAGQMGMTRQLLVTIQAAAQSWIQVRVPEFGILIARREFTSLNRMFRRVMWLSTLALTLAGAVFLVGVVVLNCSGSKYADILLPVGPTLIMLLGLLVFQMPFGETQYLRAHKKEPVFLATMASNIAIGLSVWYFGKHYGAFGAAWGYLASICFVTGPAIHYVFVKSRAVWHVE